MGTILGYILGSLRNQDLSEQKKALSMAGVETIFTETLTSIDGDRPEFKRLMATVRAGDTIVVQRIDRFARNTRHFLEMTQDLNRKGVCLKVLGIQLNTATENGQLMLSMLRAIAEFERSVLLERQKEGIEEAKLAGKFKGRKATARAKADRVMKLLEKGMTRQQVADKLKIGVASVYRILKDAKEEDGPRAKSAVTSTRVTTRKKTKPREAKNSQTVQKKVAEPLLKPANPDDQLSLF
jgi:DNA invertase Pin-like site-specific DNA recombinase